MTLLKPIGFAVICAAAVWAAYCYGQEMFMQVGVGLASMLAGVLLVAFDTALQLLGSIRDELQQLNKEIAHQRSKP